LPIDVAEQAARMDEFEESTKGLPTKNEDVKKSEGNPLAAEALDNFQPVAPPLSAEAEADDEKPRDLMLAHFAADAGILHFDVDLAKNGNEGFGLAHIPIEDETNTLVVVAIQSGGCLWRRNEKTAELGKPEHTVRPGDRIVSVNGVFSDVITMRTSLKNQSVTLRVERWPEKFIVPVRRRYPTERLGLATEIAPSESENDRMALLVNQISDGYFADWNNQASATKRLSELITCGTEVSRIGDIDSSPEAMREALNHFEGSIDIEFTRPPLEPDDDED